VGAHLFSFLQRKEKSCTKKERSGFAVLKRKMPASRKTLLFDLFEQTTIQLK